eukprot:2591737-Alexandrium_andersonii.AAC.1
MGARTDMELGTPIWAARKAQLRLCGGGPSCLVPNRRPWRKVGIPGTTVTSQSLRKRLQLR